MMDPCSYLRSCFHCGKTFDAVASQWCGCDVNLRTLVCPHCRSCFCSAGMPYKRTFWEASPLALRQDARRFGAAVPVQLSDSETSGAALVVPKDSAPLVLIVDDDESIRSFVSCVVSQLGYRTIVADSPHLGLNLARSPDVNLIITDALIPGMDGREMCKRIKEADTTGLKRVIVMTSLYTSLRYRNEAFKAFRADEYLSKPLNIAALAEALARFAPLNAEGGEEATKGFHKVARSRWRRLGAD